MHDLDLQMLAERVNATEEFARILGDILANKRVLDACKGIVGIANARVHLKRKIADLENQLATCGDRLVQLGPAVAPEADAPGGVLVEATLMLGTKTGNAQLTHYPAVTSPPDWCGG